MSQGFSVVVLQQAQGRNVVVLVGPEVVVDTLTDAQPVFLFSKQKAGGPLGSGQAQVLSKIFVRHPCPFQDQYRVSVTGSRSANHSQVPKQPGDTGGNVGGEPGSNSHDTVQNPTP